MAHDFLVYEFGTDEEKAQLARQKVERWAQGFRLGKKLTLKFDRVEPNADADAKAEDGEKPSKRSAKKKAGAHADGTVAAIVRLDFSAHEKLSHQRWLDRIPTEEPFKSAKGKVVRSNDPAHRETSERFDALD
jgi:hypothetical protein